MEQKNQFKDTIIFNGKTFSVAERELTIENKKNQFEIIQRPRIALIIPMLSKEKLLFIKQYRAPINQTILEFPAGKVEIGENSLEAARRELLEETGYFAQQVEKFAEFFSAPHLTDELIEVFIGSELIKMEKNLKPKEFITNKFFSISELVQNLESFHFIDSKTLSALFIFLRKINH